MPSSRTARSSLRKGGAPRCGMPEYTSAHCKCTISGMPPPDDDRTLPATSASAAADGGSGGESLLAALAREISGPTPLQEAFARYQADKLLGAGGNGIVYRAYDPALQRYVALKFLRREEPATIARFLREARAQARV